MFDEALTKYADHCWNQKRCAFDQEYSFLTRSTKKELKAMGHAWGDGRHFTSLAGLAVKQAMALVRARLECLLTAVEKAGMTFSDSLFQDIVGECRSLLQNVVSYVRISPTLVPKDAMEAAVSSSIREQGSMLLREIQDDLQMRLQEERIKQTRKEQEILSLQELANEPLTLVKRDGTRHEFRGHAQSDLIITFNAKLPVEDGDTVERKLPSGHVERYTVLDVGFKQSFDSIESHYQMKVKKTEIAGVQNSSVTNVYNVHGPNAKINIESTDRSYNIANVSERELFQDLRGAIQSGVADQNQQPALISAVDALEAATGTRSYLEKLQQFMANAANCMTIVGPFLPALTQMIPK